MTKIQALPAPKPRISEKVRRAVDLRVRRGLSIADAAAEVGLSRNGLAKALKRPPVSELVAETQAKLVRDVEALRAVARARALEVARDLLETGSEGLCCANRVADRAPLSPDRLIPWLP